MMVKRRLRIRWLSLFFLLVLPVAAYGGVPEVSNVMVTDVTTTSFSIIWAASEASTAGLKVYADENGTVLDAVITPHPIESGDDTIKTAAEDNGVMKVRVTGLDPGITYYFMAITTSKLTDDTTDYPVAAPFMSVTTESETVRTYESGGNILPFSNDLIIEPCYLNDGATPAEGTLLLATVAGGSHPITAFVGDGVDSPYAIIDLNNIFGRDTYENLDLAQGLNLTLLNFRGMDGNSIVTHEVPLDESLSEIKEGDSGLKAGWNFVSFQLEPGVTDIEAVLGPIMDKVNSIWAYDTVNDKWLYYNKSAPWYFNDLLELHCSLGYWVYLDAEGALKVNGNFCLDSIPLRTGWNLVGYRSIETVRVSDAIAPIIDKVSSVWAYETADSTWLTYFPGGPPYFNNLYYIEPGKAYWLDVKEDCEW